MQLSYFNSEEITLLTAVLERVCADEQVVDENDRASIGKRLILIAQAGERFHALADYAARGGLIPQLHAKSKASHSFAAARFSMVDPSGDGGHDLLGHSNHKGGAYAKRV